VPDHHALSACRSGVRFQSGMRADDTAAAHDESWGRLEKPPADPGGIAGRASIHIDPRSTGSIQ
jgi:hypothetical protein